MFGAGEIDDIRRKVGCGENGCIPSKLSCTKNMHDNQKLNM